jgi:magnesium-transporting ATPase (P-type)
MAFPRQIIAILEYSQQRKMMSVIIEDQEV